MIHCPACNAENPIGTKLCVKCGTELPKSAPVGSAEARKEAQNQPEGRPLGVKVKDASQDLVDIIWLAILLFLIIFGFWGNATHWTFRLVDVLQPRMAQEPAPPPAPVRKVVRKAQPVKVAVIPKPKPAPTAVPTPKPLGEQKPAVYVSPELLFAKSKARYDKDDYQGSFKLLKQCLDVDPTYARAYFGLGYLYSRFKMDDAAVRMYEMSLRFDQRHADSVNNLAMMYLRAGNQADAEYLLKKAVELDPKDPDFRFNLGNVYLDQQRWQEANQELRIAAQARPDDASVLNALAISYEGLGQKDSALSTWKQVLDKAADPALVKQAQNHMEYLKKQG
jgi:Flp pilus assembly protein TadD